MNFVNLEDLNHCDIKQAHLELLKCCGSNQWTEKMLATRPYKSVSHLLELAGQIWSDLGEVDYLEAFAAHPKIGASKPLRIMQKIRKAGLAKNKPE